MGHLAPSAERDPRVAEREEDTTNGSRKDRTTTSPAAAIVVLLLVLSVLFVLSEGAAEAPFIYTLF